MNLERTKLLQALGRVYKKGPKPTPALWLAYAGVGTARATIAEDAFTVTGTGGAASFTVTLDETLTLTDLTVQLELNAGWTATVDPGYEAVLAVALAPEVERLLIAQPKAWFVYTNPLWFILDPLRRQMVKRAPAVDVGVDQLNLLKAAGFFAEFWGTYTDTERKVTYSEPITAGRVSVYGDPVNLAVSQLAAPVANVEWANADAAGELLGRTFRVGADTAIITAYASFVLTLDKWAGPTLDPTVTLGGVPYIIEPHQLSSEADDLYVARQLDELLRPRENNLALADLIETDFPGTIVEEVRNLLSDVFLFSNTPMRNHRLLGDRYNTATAEVRLGTFPEKAIIDAAEDNAAAGIKVFVLGRAALAVPESNLVLQSTTLQIGEAPPLRIGGLTGDEGKIGLGKIGS